MSDNTNVVVIPGPTVGYTDLMDKALLAQQAEGREPYFPLRPSSAGYCSRRLGYDLMNFRGYASFPPEKRDPNIIRLLSLGSSVEWHSIANFELIKKVDPSLKVRYKQQVVSLFRLEPLTKTDPGILIEGSMDLAMMSSVTNLGGIGDVKSAKDKFSAAYATKWDENINKFDGMKSLVKLPSSETAWYADDLEAFLSELRDPFFEDNFRQVNSYACTAWSVNHGIDHGFIYRYCKNDSRHIEIRFRPSQKLFQQLERKYNTVNKAVDRKAPDDIPRDSFLGSMRCAFCPYSKQCWGGEDTLRAFFNTFPQKEWPTEWHQFVEAEELDKAFKVFQAAVKQEPARDAAEETILKIMWDNKTEKVRFSDGSIYEAKYLKSPRPHYELRRTK